MTEAERCQLVAVRDAIDAIRRAFGAPGDYGYGTPQGEALFELYKQRAAVADALEAAVSPYDPRSKSHVERAELRHRRDIQRAALDDTITAVRRDLQLARITPAEVRLVSRSFAADQASDGRAGGNGSNLRVAESPDLGAEEVTPASRGAVGFILQGACDQPLNDGIAPKARAGLGKELVRGLGHEDLRRQSDDQETSR